MFLYTKDTLRCSYIPAYKKSWLPWQLAGQPEVWKVASSPKSYWSHSNRLQAFFQGYMKQKTTYRNNCWHILCNPINALCATIYVFKCFIMSPWPGKVGHTSLDIRRTSLDIEQTTLSTGHTRFDFSANNLTYNWVCHPCHHRAGKLSVFEKTHKFGYKTHKFGH